MPLSLTEVLNPRPGWYRGDFHAHTNYSDGVLTPPELLHLARAEGLDFFAITDHNAVGAYDHFGPSPDVVILPGIEVTYKRGHYNVFGLSGPAPGWLGQLAGRVPETPAAADPIPEINGLLHATAEGGRLNSINHPRLAPWAWEFPETDLRAIHCVEIWNDPSWPDNRRDNPRAIALWTDWLNAGYRITAVGGSDFHRPVPPPIPPKPPDRLGLPSTYVFASELSGAAILEALRQRRAYVSMAPRVAFHARLDGETHDIGADLGLASGEAELTATLSDCPGPARAQIVKNGRPLAEMTLHNDGATLRCRDRLDPSAPAWYRFDVTDPDGLMLAITNPIFAGPRREPDRLKFGDFIQAAGSSPAGAADA